MAEKLFLSTEQIEGRDRNSFWSQLIGPVYEVSSYDGDTSRQLQGQILSLKAGPVQIGKTTFNDQKYSRGNRLIALSSADVYYVQLITAGTLTGNYFGTDVKAGLGDIVFIDMSKPVESLATAGGRVTMVLPKPRIDRLTNWRPLHGVVLSAQAAGTALINLYLHGLIDMAAEMTIEEAAAAEEALVTLLASAVNGRPRVGSMADTPEINAPIRHAIIRYIESNLSSANLGVNEIQKQFNISRTHLYRMFEQDHGIAKLIRNKRLDRVVHQMVRSKPSRLTLKQVAYENGFDTPEALARAFRERFNASPKELLGGDNIGELFLKDPENIHNHLSDPGLLLRRPLPGNLK
jgi:AraC-like DNA-binding protein